MPSSSPGGASVAEGNNNVWMEATQEAISPKNDAYEVQGVYARRLLANFELLRQQTLSEGARSLCDVEITPGWVHNDNGGADSGGGGGADAAVGGVDGTPGPRVFYAHRTVLAASSPYFMAMFTRGLAEASRERVVLQSISDRSLESLLGFIYSGRIDISRDNVQELMVAADMIELEEVVQLCTSYLITELEPSNALGIFRFAAAHNCTALAGAALAFIHEHFVDVCKGDEFRDVPRDLLVELLASENLRVDFEYQVFRGAMAWIEANIDARRRYIFDVLKFVRLPLVPSKLLDSYAAQCRDISIGVALDSVKKDLVLRKGSLVRLEQEPRRCAKKTIYVIGGSQRELRSAWTKSECTYNTVEVYDTFKGVWRQRAAPMRVGRILPGIAVMNGMIFVCGGEVESQILANGEVYDPGEDAWRPMASMTVPRCEFGMCALGGRLYALGGWVGEDIGGTIERYDPTTDRWTLLSPAMPEPRFSMGIISHQGLIYLVGGCTHSRRHMQELVSFNPTTGEWTTHASMLVPRSQMGCAVMDDHLYVLGGTNRHNEVLRSVERYSFRDNSWRGMPQMREARASPSVAAADGKIYVFGGDKINEVNFYRARTTICSSECFDPLTETWAEIEALPESRSEAGAVVI